MPIRIGRRAFWKDLPLTIDPAIAAQIADAKVAALHALVLQSLDDDQAVDLVSIPLAGKTSIADHMVIASGRSGRQVASMATKLAEKIKSDLGKNVRIQGLQTADWVLIDCGDVIVHLFKPDVRQFYNLERMWGVDGAAANPGPPPPPPVIVSPR